MQVNKMGGQALDEAASTAPILCLILIVRAPDEGRDHFARFRSEGFTDIGRNMDRQLYVALWLCASTGSPLSRRPGFSELWFLLHR